jgi:hypothetical protein
LQRINFQYHNRVGAAVQVIIDRFTHPLARPESRRGYGADWVS